MMKKAGAAEVNRDTIAAEVVEYAQNVSAMSMGTTGNVSARMSEDIMVITPSGVPYADMREEDMCEIDIESGVNRTTNKASSETPMHRAIYQVRPDVKAIVHTHSLYATAMAVAGKPIQPIHYVISTLGNEVPVAPYVTYGTPELGQAAADVAKSGVNGILLQNHGVLAFGTSLGEAFYHAELIEYLAHMTYLTVAHGGPKLLTDAQLDVVRQRFRGYGRR